MVGPSVSAVSMVATSEGSVLQAVIRAETQAFGKLEFDVEGELPGFARLYLFQGEPMDVLPPCSVLKKPKQEL